MATAQYRINGYPIKRPSKFKIERYNITNMDRLANGLMVGDLIAKKQKYYFTYEAITAKDLNHILNLIWNNDSLFYPFTYVENNVEKTATVYSGSIPQELFMTGSDWVWKNVQFDLIEQ